jgi:hypothetical protein
VAENWNLPTTFIEPLISDLKKLSDVLGGLTNLQTGMNSAHGILLNFLQGCLKTTYGYDIACVLQQTLRLSTVSKTATK